MLLSELSSKLNKIRRKKHLSLSELADHLDIPLSFLQDIEKGNPNVLATPESRHSIKVYAVTLGIPPAEIIKQLNSIKSPGSSGKKGSSYFPSLLKHSWVRRILLSAAILLLASVVYSQLTSNSLETKNTTTESNNPISKPSPSASLEEKNNPQDSSALPQKQSNENNTAESTTSTQTNVPSITADQKTWSSDPSPNLINIMKNAEQVKPTKKELAASNELQKTKTVPPKTEKSAEKTPVKAQKKSGHQLEIYAASGNCWVGYTADGEEKQKVLNKGKSLTIDYKKTLNISLGNPSVVVMHNDGVALGRTDETKLYFASGASAKQQEKTVQDKKQADKTNNKQASQDVPQNKKTAPMQQEKIPAIAEGEHQIKIFAQDGPCWIGFSSGNINKQLLLRQGEVHTFIFKNSAALQFGNISAVRIFYDGKETQRVYSNTLGTRNFPPKTK